MALDFELIGTRYEELWPEEVTVDPATVGNLAGEPQAGLNSSEPIGAPLEVAPSQRTTREKKAYHHRTITIPSSLESLKHPELVDGANIPGIRTSFRVALSSLGTEKDGPEVDNAAFANWVNSFHKVTEEEQIPAVEPGALPDAMARLADQPELAADLLDRSISSGWEPHIFGENYKPWLDNIGRVDPFLRLRFEILMQEAWLRYERAETEQQNATARERRILEMERLQETSLGIKLEVEEEKIATIQLPGRIKHAAAAVGSLLTSRR